MAITLVNTWGLTTSNVYVSLVEAEDIVAQYVLNSIEWDRADDTLKKKSILAATLDIEAPNWHGGRYYWNQNLQFPRIPPGGDRTLGIGGDATSDGAATYYSLLAWDEYSRKQQDRVKRASCFQAIYKLEMNTGKGRVDIHRDMQRKGVSSWSKSGPGISESFSYSTSSDIICPEAWDLLKHYKAPRRVVRGDAVSMHSE